MVSSNPTRSPTRLLIVDGHAYAYRTFYAIRYLKSPAGLPTNAIYGFIQSLDKLRAELKPSHAMVIWDGGLAAERTQVLPEYKAQRPPMPIDLESQLDQITEYLRAAGIASHCQPGVEADEWIATVARKTAGAIDQVIIASSDKDFMQLVSPRVGLVNPAEAEPVVWGAEQVRARSGVEPAQVVDWLSLVGDSVDNIRGVPGIGPKNATKLLSHFGSLEQLFAHLDEVKPALLQTRLRAAEAVARRNQGLIRLKDDLPGELRLADLEVKPGNAGQLRQLFERWGFKTWLARLASETPRQADLF